MAGGEDDLHLPPEICSEILTRVPIKSILRFRSVCKLWHSLVSCPNFKPKTLSDRVLLHCEKSRVWSLTSHDESFSESGDHGDDLPYCGRRLEPVGSCDGLICFYRYRVNRSKKEHIRISTFFIYNPAIRKIVKVPSLSFGLRTHRPHCYGFGFDSKACDYKVMLILSVHGDATSYVGFMFDLRNGVWREFTPILPAGYHRSRMRGPKFYLNGSVHWVGYGDENVSSILSFNMSDESSFRVISMPPELNRSYRLLITTSGGLIHALAGGCRETYDPQICSAWVMKEYGVTESWTKLFTVGMPTWFPAARVEALVFRGPEAAAEVLLRRRARREFVAGKVVDSGILHLILRNIETGESECLLSTDKSISNMVFYKESLVLM